MLLYFHTEAENGSCGAIGAPGLLILGFFHLYRALSFLVLLFVKSL